MTKLGCLILIALTIASIGADTGTEVDPVASIAQLGSDAFVDREGAKLELIKYGAAAMPHLQSAAAKEKDPEIRRSLHAVIRKIIGKSIREIKVLGRHEGGDDLWVNRCVISPDSRHVFSCCDDGVRVWDLKTGKNVGNFGRSGSWSMALSADAKLLSRTAGNSVQIWDWQEGELIKEFPAHQAEAWGVAILPDGKRVASVGWDSKLSVWDIAKAAEVKAVELPGKGRAMAMIPDGKSALIAVFESKHKPATLQLWDLDKGKVKRVYEGHEGSITAVKLSPDGKQAVSSSMDRTVRLWNLATGKEIRKMTGHKDGVESVAFSPGGRYILSCGAEGDATLRLWETATGKEIWHSTVFPKCLISINFTPDGKYFVATGKDSAVRLWAFGLDPKKKAPAK